MNALTKMAATCNMPANQLTNAELETILLARKAIGYNFKDGKLQRDYDISKEELAKAQNELGIAI